MKCFNHRESDAVGSCKACSKGLCGGCAVDVGNGLSCRDTCEEQVRRINDLVERNIQMSPVSQETLGRYPGAYLANGVFSIIAGGLFALLGQSMDGTFRAGITAVGVLVAAFGVWQVAYAWGLRRTTRNLK